MSPMRNLAIRKLAIPKLASYNIIFTEAYNMAHCEATSDQPPNVSNLAIS